MDLLPANVFAYGTLKTGQCRERFWAYRPHQIVRAWIRGKLYDTGPYPALGLGNDLIAGELWMFQTEQMAEILRVLDNEEGYYGPESDRNLYARRSVECETQDGRTLAAQVYVYARQTEFEGFRALAPSIIWDQRGFVIWPDGADW